ncbi:putative phage holin [Streptomyces sp. NPDC002692]
MTLAEVINVSVSGLVAGCALLFLVEYTWRARWEETSIGRYFVAAVATVGLLALYTVVITLVGLDGTTATVLRIIRSVLLLGIAGLLLQATRAVRRAYPRRRGR